MFSLLVSLVQLFFGWVYRLEPLSDSAISFSSKCWKMSIKWYSIFRSSLCSKSFSRLCSCSVEVFIGNECDSGDEPVDTDDEFDKLVGDVDKFVFGRCSITVFLPFISSSCGCSSFSMVSDFDEFAFSSGFGVDVVNDVEASGSSFFISLVLFPDCVS